MNKKEYLTFARQFTDEMIILTEKKNNDYTGKADDFFQNFKIVEKLGICSVEQGFLTRISDKISRLAGFASGNKLEIKNESVIDTLQDLANYSIIFAGYLKSKVEIKNTEDDNLLKNEFIIY